MQRITPVDIQHREFKRALQGYDRADVDQFLDEVIETLEDDAQQHAALEAEISDLKERISHFKAMEESLQNTLVLAQRTADEVKASAHKEADLIREQARLAAEREVASYNDAIADVRREHQAAFEAAERAKGELRHLLTTQLALLDKASLERPRESVPASVTSAPPAAPAVEEGKHKAKNGHQAAQRSHKDDQPPTEDTTHIVVQ